MNLRPYPGLTLALATALASAVPLPAAADTDGPMVQHCYTVALTDEEVAAGAVSQIDCYEVPAGTPMDLPMGRGNITFAIVYDVSDTFGNALGVVGPSCSGGNTVYGTGTTWDNVISATTLVSCGNAKHWQWNNFTGSSQLVTGAAYSYHMMNATMNNATSSIQYAP